LGDAKVEIFSYLTNIALNILEEENVEETVFGKALLFDFGI